MAIKSVTAKKKSLISRFSNLPPAVLIIIIIIIISLFLALGLFVVLNYANEATINFKKNNYIMKVGEKEKLEVIYDTQKGYKPDIEFVSKDSNIASSTKDGKIEGKRAGETKVFAKTKGGQKIEATITVNDKKQKNKTIYLTFESGPDRKVTGEILSILDKYNAKATFFVKGESAKLNENILKEQHEKGHTIGILCQKEDYANIYSSVDAYLKDFYKAEKVIKNIIGERPMYWRFPGTSENYLLSKQMKKSIIDTLHKQHYTEIDFTAKINDSVGKKYSSEEMGEYGIKSLDDAMKSGYVPVINIHDSSLMVRSPRALEIILKHYSKLGYDFQGIKDYQGPENLVY